MSLVLHQIPDDCPILPTEMVNIILSFLDHKTICALQASILWSGYLYEIEKIRVSHMRLNCYNLGYPCAKCYQLCDGYSRHNGIQQTTGMCDNCWFKCDCGTLIMLSDIHRCVDCCIPFCNKCYDRSITWEDTQRRDRDYITCRDCCEPKCFECGEEYDCNTASKCNKCFNIYCERCDNGICYNCGIHYMSPMLFLMR